MTAHNIDKKWYTFLKEATSDFSNDVVLKSTWFMDLHIEVLGNNKVSVAHYYEQNWDLVPDPDIVFKLDNWSATPISFRNQFCDYDISDIRNQMQLKRALGLEKFTRIWFRNLKAQKFIN